VGAESVIANYLDNLEVARALGLKKAYDLNYAITRWMAWNGWNIERA
jgi:hypothetical protein